MYREQCGDMHAYGTVNLVNDRVTVISRIAEKPPANRSSAIWEC